MSFHVLLATQQTEEGAEGTGVTEVATTTAAIGVAITTQGRAITTVTQSTPVPGPSVPVTFLLNKLIQFYCQDRNIKCLHNIFILQFKLANILQ